MKKISFYFRTGGPTSICIFDRSITVDKISFFPHINIVASTVPTDKRPRQYDDRQVTSCKPRVLIRDYLLIG